MDALKRRLCQATEGEKRRRKSENFTERAPMRHLSSSTRNVIRFAILPAVRVALEDGRVLTRVLRDEEGKLLLGDSEGRSLTLDRD